MRVQPRHALEQDPRQGDQGQGQGHRPADRGLLQQEQGALRAARAARPAHRPDQDRGEGRARPRRRSSRGESFESVAKEYSIDDASKAQGGKLPASPRASRRRRSTTRSSRPRRASRGPVKTQFGYYVFEVDKVTKASQQTLEQAKPTIKQVLASQNQQKALDEFVKDFRRSGRRRRSAARATSRRTARTRRSRRRRPTPGAVQAQTPPPTHRRASTARSASG